MSMDETGTSNQVEKLKGEKKRKKWSSTRRKITIKDFPLGSNVEPYDPIKDVNSQGPKLTLPQFLHLLPKMMHQWSKMVSTRMKKTLGILGTQEHEDVLLVMEVYIKGQWVSKVYRDEGAQVCVMSEKMMDQVGLEVSGN